MTPADAARLLAVAAIYDRRTIGEIEATAWADALQGLDPRECADAIKAHYADTTAWLMPAHVRERVAHTRRERARKRADGKVLKSIESSKSYDEQAAEKARAEARKAFADAILAKKRREGRDEQEVAS